MFSPSRLPLFSLGILLIAMSLGSCVDSSNNEPASPSSSATDVSSGDTETTDSPQNWTGLEEEAGKKYRIKVFFPKRSQNTARLDYVEPVWRETDSQGVAQYAIAQLLRGPQPDEQKLGLTPALQLTGASNCGSDFKISIADKVARLQICRSVVSAGVGDDARANSAIAATLKQFPTINTAIILDKNGNCLGDLSGENRCLKQLQQPLTTASKLTLTSLGAISVGATIKEASQASGVKFANQPSGGEEYGCAYYQLEGQLKDVSLMVTEGKISRIDIDSKQIKTLSGAGIGDTEAKIKELYSGQIETEPHEYIPGGKYLIFIPKDASEQNYRVIFETNEQGIVTRFRSGKLPEVTYVEGCV
ncbi:hypothetical protein IQ249_12040 [Lusitaniella coriacea LEGE 07157]|uniref:GerMN domain-containing protein n=1 Tax=Lusitaniella coriacea LEGE 07157 TaxID=945747 RepID=A0A8J7DWR6_9CYAN|nr:hypothetical protein [Lusitaniella coriacea]MBE9116631.1 hypothetical protein [Lusitaniella coriacea LEGE 07157]